MQFDSTTRSSRRHSLACLTLGSLGLAALLLGVGSGCATGDPPAGESAFATGGRVGGVAGSATAGAGGASTGMPAGAGSGGLGGGAIESGGANSGGATGVAGASTAGAGGEAPITMPTRVWDMTGIIGSGQSLSVGVYGTPTLTTQAYQNLKLSLGGLSVPPYDAQSTQLSLVPLIEPIRPLASGYPSAYPKNIYGESPHTAMGNEVSSLYQAAKNDAYVTVHTVVGENGQAMSVIDKAAVDTGATGHAFAATLFEVAAIARLAKAAGKTYGVGAVVLTHGETDAANTSYESDLVQLWTDYNSALSPLTGQTAPIPLLLSQQNSSPAFGGSRSASEIAEWSVGVNHPAQVVLVGPKYQYPYFTDGLHLVAKGYEMLGEKYGEAYFQQVVSGVPWQPLQPTGAERLGSVITVHFHVPVGPLLWDTILKEPHQSKLSQWKAGHGFEVSSKSGTAITISDATIVGHDVVLTCASDPGSGAMVRYAATADGAPMQNGTMRWGTLRDSDPFVGATTKQAQPNFAVAFELPLDGPVAVCTPATHTHSATACTRTCWAVSSSDCANVTSPSTNIGLPSSAIDGNASTRYSSGIAQSGATYFQIDLGAATEIDGLKLDSTGSEGDFASSVEIQVSTDGNTWTSVACGSGSTITDLGFNPQTARYIRILEQGAKGNWWSIHEANVFCTKGHDSCSSGGAASGGLAACTFVHTG